MTGFTESGFERKLAELNSTQVSIQTLSMWLIHHRKHCNTIVKVWYKEFLKAQEHRKLTFIYLVNDVVQNSKKKGGDFCKPFAPVLKKALEYMARNPDDKMKKSILRILRIWEERAVYDIPLIKDFESSYRKMWDDLNSLDVDELLEEAIEAPSVKKPDKNHAKKSKKESSKHKESKKRHATTPIATTEEATASTSTAAVSADTKPEKRDEDQVDLKKSVAKAKKRHRTKEMEQALRKRTMEEDMNNIDEWEVDGVSQLQIKLSPSPYKDPPTEDELISCIKSLEKMPSTDAITRGKIANLPPEVSDAAGAHAICIDSDATRDLLNKIKPALILLKDYNVKLDKELEDRKDVSMKLQDLIYFQKDLLTQSEHRLEEHQQYVKILTKKLEDMKSHVQSMPDLSKLPSVTDGLAPLPSAGDLFNI